MVAGSWCHLMVETLAEYLLTVPSLLSLFVKSAEMSVADLLCLPIKYFFLHLKHSFELDLLALPPFICSDQLKGLKYFCF